MTTMRPIFSDWTTSFQGDDAPADLNRRLGAFVWDRRKAFWVLHNHRAAELLADTLEERAAKARESVALLGMEEIALRARSYAFCCEQVARAVRRCLQSSSPPATSTPVGDIAAILIGACVFYAAWAVVGSVA